jgi:carboxypeptidase family protein/TonB-dependent receptor-like protein
MRHASALRWFFVVLLVLVPTLAFAQSQATTGVIEGTVTDATGGVLPGVTVTLKNTATNFEQMHVTDVDGRYRGVLLPLGPYEVRASLAGFAPQLVKGIDLGVGQTRTVDIKMSQAAVSEELVVTAEAPLIDTARTEGATRLDEDAISDLPNNGRNFLELTKLTPGVTIVQGPDGDELSINGQKGISNNVSVDGADFNNPFFGEQRGGQRPAFTFNLDAVKEMVVVADGANAEFGRSQSGFVNVITKSGTNQRSGSAHFVIKNDALSSNPKNPDGSEAPKFDSEQYQTGFTLGGPIVRDKAFYFAAFDFQKATTTKQTDPTRIEPAVVAAFASLGSPNENAPIERTNDARVFLAKADWNASAANLITLRYNYTWSEQKNGTFDVDSWGVSANALEKDDSNAGTGSVITTFRSNLLNEFRFQYAKENRPRPYDGPLITGQNRPFPDTAFDFGSSYRFGEPFFIPVTYYDTRLQFNNNVSFLRGAHSIKAGVEYNRVESVQTFLGFANGRYIFDSTAGFLEDLQNHTNNHVLLYLQQAGVGNISVEEAGTQKIPQKEPGAFLQDSWQVSPDLNIQYGLRWDAQIEPDVITPASQVFFAPFIGKTVQGVEFPSDGEIPSDTSMWQPRFGFSWNPGGDGKRVLRGSAGIFYGRVPGLSLASTRSTNGSRGQSIFRSSAVNFDGCLPIYPNKLSAACIGAPDHPDVFVFDKDFQNPRTTSLSLSWEHELIPEYAFLVKYNYAKGDHITRFRNGNDPLLINAPASCTFACGPFSSGLGAGGTNGIGVLTVVESTAKSLYQGITLGVTKRPSHNMQFQAFYTYSKDKSDDDNERDPFSFRYAKVTDLDAEYSYSDRDQRHRVNSWFLWNAPYGLDLNLRYSYRSAQPKSITASGADALAPADRCSTHRADGSCAIDAVVTRRNLGRKDNQYSSLDFRLSKQFAIGGVTLEPAIDAFNIFNSKNLRRPEVTSLVFNFDGTVQSGVGDPRQFQLAMRVLW